VKAYPCLGVIKQCPLGGGRKRTSRETEAIAPSDEEPAKNTQSAFSGETSILPHRVYFRVNLLR